MAVIILEPGEIFEHQHSTDSYSRLLAGDVVIATDGAGAPLPLMERVPTRAGVSHSLTNAGTTVALIECSMHRSTSPPPPAG
ncbi:MAG: hypothetical protein ACJ74O_08330 [Frankiaceae bacterium]